MNPFESIRNWKRKDWDAPKTEDERKRREHAEEQTDHDLQKAVQQFLADVHEEADHPWPDEPYDDHMTLAESRVVASLLKLAGIHKRTAALHTVTAHEAAITSWWLKCLTCALAFLTILLIVLTFMLWKVACHTDEQINEIRQHTEKAWQTKEHAGAMAPSSKCFLDGIFASDRFLGSPLDGLSSCLRVFKKSAAG